ncbi:MAG TPA: DNA-processing protein DprA [Chthoniobacteraceae bacterium]|jgi:DNA processing protein
MTETEASIALNMVPNLGPMRLRKLLGVFEDPQKILGARAAELRRVDGIGEELAGTIAQWEQHVDLLGELARMRGANVTVVTKSSPEYPRALREIYNPPIVLYVWGTLTERDNHVVSVVGSRKTSHYGLDCAKKLSYQLAYAGLTVVSGLARGIDTAAHQGALAAQGRTIAVLGSGLMELYPAENQALAEKIAASGAVVSEYPMQFPPSPQTFPYRNRIVAGWGSGLLVVEAGLNSGALITANQAIEHGRMVYAVPGPIDRPTSAGSNRLIQQGAKLVTSAGDILDDLDTLFPERSPVQSSAKATPLELSDEEKAVLECLSSSEMDLDSISGKTGLPIQKASSTLLALELKRLAKQLPGHQFVRL